jgi:hypothetical protein
MIGIGWATLYASIIEKYEICQTQTTIHEGEKKIIITNK